VPKPEKYNSCGPFVNEMFGAFRQRELPIFVTPFKICIADQSF